jgi:putative endonuclease
VKPRHKKRHRAWRRGRFAETLCLWSLRLKAYRILAHGYKTPVGEIDILARRGAVLAAIEVKARPTAIAASEAVSPRQQRRVARALSHYLTRPPELRSLTQRFDVMLVMPGRWPKHVQNAWPGEAL